MAVNPSERRECNESAFKCYGTAYVFEQRKAPLRMAIKILAFVSLLGPTSVGALILTFGLKKEMLIPFVFLVGVLSSIHVIVSLWAEIAHWQTVYSRYEQSVIENYMLSEAFSSLASDTALGEQAWRSKKLALDAKGEFRHAEDLKSEITDEERRMGMRVALRQMQRPCVGCDSIPTSLDSTSCNVCGNFKRRTLKWLL